MEPHTPAPPLTQATAPPSRWISLLIFVGAVGTMALLRLVVFPHTFITLAYGLPLLLCLVHRDKLLLWSMAATLAVISASKTWMFTGMRVPMDVLQWFFQWISILTTAGTVHYIIVLLDRLAQKNADLQAANQELEARGAEIARQNEELQSQSEELIQQNEELQNQGEELIRQNEELEQQSEELRAQGEELRILNTELSGRENLLQELLTSLKQNVDEASLTRRLTSILLNLLSNEASAVTILEHQDGQLVVRAWSGPDEPGLATLRFRDSLAEVVMEQGRTAYVEDLQLRPDLSRPELEKVFRSVLASPFWVRGKTAGVLKIFSREPRQWTENDFRIVQWVAAQCSLALEISRLREELADTNSRLEKLVLERTERLQEMVDELEHFSYTITHDMRAPLRAIQGFVGMLEETLDTPPNAEARDCLQRISDSARRMDRLITDALSYSKAVKHELEIRPTNVEELLRGIVHSYPALQPPKAIIHIQEDMPMVLGNEAGLIQCFSNLLGNAVKFVAPGLTPEVNIRAERVDSVVRIWFEDNGIGIPSQAQNRLFQMFQRASKAYEGTGIGLALVRKVAERMGGRVGVVSSLGEGSRFWLEFASAPEHACK